MRQMTTKKSFGQISSVADRAKVAAWALHLAAINFISTREINEGQNRKRKL